MITGNSKPNGDAMCLFQTLGHFYIFDSHALLPNGEQNDLGKANLWKFENLESAINFLNSLISRYETANIEIQPVTVTPAAKLSSKTTMSKSENTNATLCKSWSMKSLLKFIFFKNSKNVVSRACAELCAVSQWHNPR